VGTSALKAVAITDEGEPVADAEIPYGVDVPQSGWSEQDPERWVAAASKALAALGGRPTAVWLSGQMHGLVALDGSDRVVRPAILWNDQRSAEQCREVEELIGLDRLISLTGNRALTGFTAPKIVWLREHEPDAFARTRSIMLPKDLLRLRLTGERATDVADASGTLLLDVGHRRWSETLVHDLGIDTAWLPSLAKSPMATGTTAEGAIVAAGAGDQAAGAVGVGVIRPGSVSIVIGTSGVVFAPLPSYAPDPLRACTRSVTGAVDLARDGCDAVGRGIPSMAPRRGRTRRILSCAQRARVDVAARRRWPDVPSVPHWRADAARRPRCPGRLRPADDPPRRRCTRPRRPRGRRLRVGRGMGADPLDGGGADGRWGLGRRLTKRVVAADSGVGARRPRQADAARRKRRPRRGVARRRGGRAFLQCRRGGVAGEDPRHDRPRAVVERRLDAAFERFRELYPALHGGAVGNEIIG
jgi:hypothetical protein